MRRIATFVFLLTAPFAHAATLFGIVSDRAAPLAAGGHTALKTQPVEKGREIERPLSGLGQMGSGYSPSARCTAIRRPAS